MLGFLAAPLAKWLAVGAVVAVLAGGLWVESVRRGKAHEALGAAKAELRQAVEKANANAAEVERQKAFVVAANAANADRERTLAAERAKSTEFQRRLANVANSCPVDPTLADLIRERLW